MFLPSHFTYLNLGTIKDKGVELGVDAAVNRYVNVFTNYSFQAMPEVEDLPPGTTINDINWPAKNRFNAGFDFSYARFLGNLSVSYTDEAYWQDVLDAALCGHDRRLHAGQRRLRRALGRRARRHEHQGHEPGQPGSACSTSSATSSSGRWSGRCGLRSKTTDTKARVAKTTKIH